MSLSTMCSALSAGLMALATAASTKVGLVNVFSKGESGYYCIKIPYLTSLPDNSLLALGEARWGSCSDYTKTDLVMKTSWNGGKTWSALKIFHTGGEADTVGNAAPVVVGQDLIIPFCLNNSKVFIKRSGDLGETWSNAEDISSNVTRAHWKWVGLGPPAGLLLSSGRILIPGYHTDIFGPYVDNGDVSKGHAMLSDDGGKSWRLSADDDFGGRHFPNEDQAVELSGGHVAIFARGLGFFRTRTVSEDGGDHWGTTEVLETLPQPFIGCEGSTIKCRESKRLVYSGPVHFMTRLREDMSIYVSDDEGRTWQKYMRVDPGFSAYSALAWHGKNLALLYDRSNVTTDVRFEPDHMSFAALPNPCVSNDVLI
uniref:Sialidase NEU1.2 n=1 Tax=Karenia brevis TaxID=156230 RepID=K0Q5Z1_KARBR|nr:TPA_inf: sialidase NEU1.2 [Karenia brevis]